MGFYWAVSRGLTHVLGATNPDREASFLKSGYKVVAPEFFHDEKRLHVLPMILDLRQLNDRFLDFVASTASNASWARSSASSTHRARA